MYYGSELCIDQLQIVSEASMNMYKWCLWCSSPALICTREGTSWHVACWQCRLAAACECW